jgi:predicted nucleic acid-binding protein
VVCAVTRGGIVVTDDRAARERCAGKSIRFTGTIGILKACGLEHTLTPAAADAILEDMVAAGYHSPVRRISDLL